jgi:hypothetical protein
MKCLATILCFFVVHLSFGQNGNNANGNPNSNGNNGNGNGNIGNFITLQVTGQSNFNTASFSENSTFAKNLFVNGKIGIGTFTPTEPLHVFGNIRTNSTLFSSGLVSENATLNALQVSNNTIVNGKIGGIMTGLKKDYKIYKNLRGTVLLQYNVFNPKYKAPYVDRLNSRIGFEYGFRKKKSKIPLKEQ